MTLGWECTECVSVNSADATVCEFCDCPRGTGLVAEAAMEENKVESAGLIWKKAEVETSSDAQRVFDSEALEAFCDEHVVPVRQGHRLQFRCNLCSTVLSTYEEALEHAADQHSKQVACLQDGDDPSEDEQDVPAQSSKAQAAPSPGPMLESCSHCNTQAEKLMLCAGCKLVRYCSAACQRAAWKAGHKQACKNATQIQILKSRKSSLASTTTRASENEKESTAGFLTAEDGEDEVPLHKPPPTVVENGCEMPEPESSSQTQTDMAARDWADSRRERLMEELHDLQFCDLGERKTRLRGLQLELHPDKQPPEAGPARRDLAQSLFLMVQREWEAGGAAAAAAAAREEREKEDDSELARAARATAAARTKQERQRAARGEPDQPGPPGQSGQDGHASSGAKAETKRPTVSPEDFKAEWRKKYKEGTQGGTTLRQREEAEDTFIFNNLKEAAQMFDMRIQEERRLWQEQRKTRGRGEEVHIGVHDMYLVHQISGFKNWKIYDVKHELESLAGVPSHRQRLIYGDKDLQDNWDIRDYAPGTRLTLTLVLVLEDFTDYANVMRGVRHDWTSLQYASGALKADRTIVRAAMRQCWKAIHHASPRFLTDRGLFLIAVEQDPKALLIKGGFNALKSDAQVVTAAVSKDWQLLKHAAKELYSDPAVILAGLPQDWRAMSFAAEELRSNRDFCMSAVQLSGCALQYAAPYLKSDLELVLAAIRQDSRAIAHASRDLNTRPEVQEKLQGKGHATRFMEADTRAREESDIFTNAWNFPAKLAYDS